MPRYFTAFATLLCLVTAPSARAADPCAEGELQASRNGDALYLRWTGTVRFEMDRLIASEFDQAKNRIKGVVLSLSSCGGTTATMQRTIAVMKRIKSTHRLTTVVWRGATCASACINIFLEGSRRVAALSSLWLFHEPAVQGYSRAGPVTNPDATNQMVKQFESIPEVSKRWLKRLRSNIKGADWWQTGNDLWQAKSGVVTDVLGNSSDRGTREDRTLAIDEIFPCVVCGDESIYSGEPPPQGTLPDPMDMLGMPPRG
jgi:hypothetical protein